MKINFQFRIITFCFCFFVSVSSFAQGNYVPETGNNMGNLQNNVFLRNLVSQGITEFKKPDKLDGSIYLKEEFTNSKVVVKDEKKTVEGFSLRYNIMNDAMEFVENNETRSLFKTRIDRINIGGDIFVVATIAEEGKEQLKYMKALDVENMYALESYQITIQEPYYNPGMHSSCPNPKAITRTKLFAKLPSKDVAVLIDKKSDLYDLVADKEKEVKAYIKKNKVSINKQAELQQILEYYVSLQPASTTTTVQVEK